MKRSTITLLALALASSQAWSQIYKTTDENGNVSFTDTPQPDSNTEQVQLQQTNSTAPPPVIPSYTGQPEPADEDETSAGSVPTAAITSPEPETTIPMGPGNFSVSASAAPGLGKGQALQLLIDGEPQGEPQVSGFWDLTNVFRGAHDLVVEVVSAEGATLSSSAPVRVYVLRPSIN
ncbi:DUF4124 domain-containing protein [Halioglobus maricola]|uniref:DUF4124 domain-containing protein n=1 Tax=Halioglobus maricola TaxID=2601894 RepID=UPI0014788135|nr:DUF4124 domain-containing protein [Halioglobus maricola]